MHLGRYELLRRLGRGGMAEVFEARLIGAEGFERRVALKRVIPHFAGEASFGRMFLDEAKIASKLHHHNIVAVLDYGTEDGVPYQVLELVDGTDARSLTRDGVLHGRPIPLAAALHITAEVARGLHHAHEACDDAGRPLEVVHRDVTPGNMLVSWGGDVKLSDFGIAVAADRTERTSTGVAKGKLAYMPPEQALAAGVDRRSDVFALGCSLHALLTGKSPVNGQEALAAMLRGEPLPVDDARLAPEVADVVRRATMPAPRDRYATAQELAQACEALPAATNGPNALRGWLAELRPLVEAERVSTGLVALEPPAGLAAGAHDASTRAARPTPTTEPVAGLTVEPPAVEIHRARTSRPAFTAAVVALLVLGVTAGGVAGFRGFATETQEVAADAGSGSADAGALEAAARALPAPAVAAPSPPEVARAAIPDAGRAHTSAAIAGASRRPHRHAPRSPTAITEPEVHVAEPAAPEPVAPPSPHAPGWLSVFGSGAVRARIRVDGSACCDAVSGAPFGFGPKRIRLSTGAHRVSLETPEGATLGPYPVVIRETHTEGHPQRLRAEP